MSEDHDKWNFKDTLEGFSGARKVGVLQQRLQGSVPGLPRWSVEEIRRLLPRRR
jgi:hypothetical protein